MTPLDIFVFTASLVIASIIVSILIFYLYKIVVKENMNEYELIDNFV